MHNHFNFISQFNFISLFIAVFSRLPSRLLPEFRELDHSKPKKLLKLLKPNRLRKILKLKKKKLMVAQLKSRKPMVKQNQKRQMGRRLLLLLHYHYCCTIYCVKKIGLFQGFQQVSESPYFSWLLLIIPFLFIIIIFLN